MFVPNTPSPPRENAENKNCSLNATSGAGGDPDGLINDQCPYDSLRAAAVRVTLLVLPAAILEDRRPHTARESADGLLR